MLMFRSTHKALMAAEVKRCSDLLAQKDEQIADLKKLVFTPTLTHEELLPVRVANAVLDGKEVMPKRNERAEAEDLAEADRILSGQYDMIEDYL